MAVAIEVPHGPVVDVLLDRGIAVYAINPKQLDRLRDRFSVAGSKDDRPTLGLHRPANAASTQGNAGPSTCASTRSVTFSGSKISIRAAGRDRTPDLDGSGSARSDGVGAICTSAKRGS